MLLRFLVFPAMTEEDVELFVGESFLTDLGYTDQDQDHKLQTKARTFPARPGCDSCKHLEEFPLI